MLSIGKLNKLYIYILYTHILYMHQLDKYSIKTSHITDRPIDTIRTAHTDINILII